MMRLFFIVALCLFNTLTAAEKQKPISLFVVIPSYNNEQWCIENLSSIITQTYPHWHAYYINDCSKDKTGGMVDEFIKQYNVSDKITVQHNEERHGALANIYSTIQKADPNTVVIIIDGDDKLANKNVFRTIAKIYQKHPEVWLTYGNYLPMPNERKRKSICQEFPKEIMEQTTFRRYKYVTGHLRTFYAGLFQLIKKEDLMENGEFLPSAGDVATMMPMCEMAALGHIRFVPKILYIYNDANPINDFKNRPVQAHCSHLIRTRPAYKSLRKAPWKH
ncbi:MAG: hypothetical protein JWO53_56 [Chlamydiia bacterium]|nr:hypothetical protein [Chlamydiia bacterium]